MVCEDRIELFQQVKDHQGNIFRCKVYGSFLFAMRAGIISQSQHGRLLRVAENSKKIMSRYYFSSLHSCRLGQNPSKFVRFSSSKHAQTLSWPEYLAIRRAKRRWEMASLQLNSRSETNHNLAMNLGSDNSSNRSCFWHWGKLSCFNGD